MNKNCEIVFCVYFLKVHLLFSTIIGLLNLIFSHIIKLHILCYSKIKHNCKLHSCFYIEFQYAMSEKRVKIKGMMWRSTLK